MVHQPCLQQLAIMLKQAGLDHIATTDDRAALLDAIANYSRTAGHQALSLQVSLHQHLCSLLPCASTAMVVAV